MTNWVGNFIKITGTKSNLDVLKGKLTEQKDESINFMEYLIGLGDIPDNYYEKGWYDYNVKRFGTKCDIPFSQLELKIEEDLISIVAGSAWSPIIPFLSKLCERYNVDAINDYYEPRSGFGGRAEIDSCGRDFVHHCSYMEAVFLYENWSFWEQVSEMIEEEQYETFEELMDELEFLSEEDKEKIKVVWNETRDL